MGKRGVYVTTKRRSELSDSDSESEILRARIFSVTRTALCPQAAALAAGDA